MNLHFSTEWFIQFAIFRKKKEYFSGAFINFALFIKFYQIFDETVTQNNSRNFQRLLIEDHRKWRRKFPTSFLTKDQAKWRRNVPTSFLAKVKQDYLKWRSSTLLSKDELNSHGLKTRYFTHSDSKLEDNSLYRHVKETIWTSFMGCSWNVFTKMTNIFSPERR